MMNRRAWMRTGLCLLAALLTTMSPAAPSRAGGEEEEQAAGLVVVGEDAPEPTPLPTLTPEPTVTPTPEPTATPIPYYTSVRYPRDKVHFEDEIWSILTRQWGLSDSHAAGLMGCVQLESGFSPYNAEGMGDADDRGKYAYDTDDGVGFGLCQWTYSGHKKKLLARAEARGGPGLVWDFDTQMAHWCDDMDFRAIKATASMYEACEWAVIVYERPNQKYSNSWPGTRYKRALLLYKKHTGKAYDEPALKFTVTSGDVEAQLQPGKGRSGADGAAATISVQSNYYWRLQTEGGDGWLTVSAHCGYALDGEKPLTLRFSALPEAGETWKATLRFDIYRGDSMEKTVPIALTGRGEGEPPALTVYRGRLTRKRI